MLPTFVATTILSGRLHRHIGHRARPWITIVLPTEIVVLATLSILAGTGVLHYHDNTKLVIIAMLAMSLPYWPLYIAKLGSYSREEIRFPAYRQRL